jgi:hypothetical protein
VFCVLPVFVCVCACVPVPVTPHVVPVGGAGGVVCMCVCVPVTVRGKVGGPFHAAGGAAVGTAGTAGV